MRRSMQIMIKRLRDMTYPVFIWERNCARATRTSVARATSCMRIPERLTTARTTGRAPSNCRNA